MVIFYRRDKESIDAENCVNTQDNIQYTQVNTQDSAQNTQVNTQFTFEEKILQFCVTPRSKKEMVEYMGYKDAKSFGIRYIKPLVKEGKRKMSIPEKPSSRNQKYVAKNKHKSADYYRRQFGIVS